MAQSSNANVYVFNVYSETMSSLSVNGISAGTVNGWATTAPIYTPNQLVVPRTLNSSDSPGKFWNGKNLVTISWADGAFNMVVTIDGNQFPITEDLLIFVSRNAWRMVNPFGVDVANGAVNEGPVQAQP